jgi:energy-converting hydrogenase Eha subunit F
MRSASALLVLSFMMAFHANAGTRAPKSGNERSLLYWRYLCEKQIQNEKPIAGIDSGIELNCPTQGWRVEAQSGLVSRVVDEAN